MTRSIDSPPRILPFSGLWGCALTALALFVFVALAGCGQRPAPVAGWVDEARLISLHPGKGMIDGLDRRLRELRGQRVRLTGVASSAERAPEASNSIPAVSGLPQPDPAVIPPLFSMRLNEEEIHDVTRSMKQQGEWEYLRRERELNARQTKTLRDKLDKLDADYTRARIAVTEGHRANLMNADLALDRARDIISRQRDDPQAQQRLLEAEKNQKSTRERHQKDLDAVEAAFERKRGDAIADNARQLKEQKSRLRREVDQETARRVDGIVAQWSGDVEPDSPTPVDPLPMHASVEAERTLDSTGLNPSTDESAATRKQALAGIDAQIARLAEERRQAAEDLKRDIRVAAESVARQHGVKLSWTSRKGTELTDQMTKWLREYWPARQAS